jgi:hypothetical protein
MLTKVGVLHNIRQEKPFFDPRPIFCRYQGDQIGRIFAQGAIVFFGQFLQEQKSGPNFRAAFLYHKSCVSILQKMGLGYILGVFSQTRLVALVDI